MLQIDNVLVPTELSVENTALWKVIKPLLKQAKARLHLVYEAEAKVQWTPDQVGLPEEITTVQYKSSEDDLSVGEILEYIEAHDIDLVVMAVNSRWSLTHHTPSAIANGLARRSDVPLLVIPAETSEHPLTVSRIVVPIDFSDYSTIALHHAKELAALYKAALLLYFVAEEHTVAVFSDAGVPAISRVKVDPDIVDKADEALQQLYTTTDGPNGEVSYHIGHGNPSHRILPFARNQQADMIVMATHGLTAHEPFSLGSVTERILRRTDRPLFVLQAFGHSLVG